MAISSACVGGGVGVVIATILALVAAETVSGTRPGGEEDSEHITGGEGDSEHVTGGEEDSEHVTGDEGDSEHVAGSAGD